MLYTNYVLGTYFVTGSLHLWPPSPIYPPPPSPHPCPASGNHQSVLCIYELGGFCLFFLLNIPHMCEIIKYLSFSALLIPFSIQPSRSIHVVKNGKISFLFYGWVIFQESRLLISQIIKGFLVYNLVWPLLFLLCSVWIFPFDHSLLCLLEVNLERQEMKTWLLSSGVVPMQRQPTLTFSLGVFWISEAMSLLTAFQFYFTQDWPFALYSLAFADTSSHFSA